MKKVAITGNIGSGKSWVCKLFEHGLGIPVFNSDVEAKRLYFNPDIRKRMEERFGTGLYLSDTSLNTKHIADIIFHDATAQHDLESILYPPLFVEFDHWAEEQVAPYVLFESALVFEKHLESHFDEIVLVTASEETRLRRAMRRDRCEAEIVRERMARQWPEEQKRALADHVIWHENDDEDEVLMGQITRLNEVFVSVE